MAKRGKDEEDAALWRRVAAAASPLKGRKPAPHRSAKPTMPATEAQRSAAPAPSRRPEPLTRTKPGHVPRAAPLDRQTSRDLEKGRLEFEGRLDLHGMRQRDAHAELRRFLKGAQARGARHVLVITGKGADPNAAKSFYEAEERGVLRQAVPRWLAEPDFAGLVVSFSPAPRRLGGDGALYVRLRKAKL
jgi:DNA-nicking Smr family endonuclease